MSILSSLGLLPKAAVVDEAPPPSLNRLLRHVSDGACLEAEKLLHAASDESRERLIHAFSQRDDALDLAQQWVRSCSASSIARTVLGAAMIARAWKVRGSAYAEAVDPAAWEPFRQGLADAVQALLEAARLDPAAADPYAWLILAEVGAGGERGRIDHYFAQANARTPLHWPTHYKYFMITTAKWGGSHEEMFRFARKSAQGAPRGSMLHCLMALAYCEYALALEGESRQQLRKPAHAERIRAALYAWLDASAATLEDRIDVASSAFRTLGLNHFAVACYLCGARQEARVLVAALDREITLVPWAWIASGSRENRHLGFVHDRVQRELGRARDTGRWS